MTRSFGLAALLAVCACSTHGQSKGLAAPEEGENAAANLPVKSMLASPFAQPAVAEPAAPAPQPRFVFGGRDDYRWQLGLAIAFYRFQSDFFNASAIGVKTSLSYFTCNWFALEGNVTAAFAPEIFDHEHVKLLTYGGGPKIAWRQKQWEPWGHGIFGGAHEQPQVIGGLSRNSYSIQVGGGADYRWAPRLAFRFEGDYVLTGFFGQHHNDFQLAVGAVLHF